MARGVTGLAPGSTWRMVGERALEAGGASQAASNALVSGKRLFPNIKDWGKLWRQQVVQTPKNLLGDESWGRLVLGMLQGGAASGLKALRADAASYLHLATEWERMPVAIRGTLANIGKGGYVPQLGESMSQTTRSKVFSTAEHSLFEAGLNLVNPAGFAQSAFGVAGAAAKGAARPWWIGVFQTVNDFQHATFRYAAFEDELTHLLAGAAADFKAHLASQGHNVNPLTDSGGFSPQLVAKLAGAREAARWRAISDRAVGLAEERAKFLFGDYGVPNKLEEALGGAVPFMGWALRAYPVAVQMALDHPVVALGLYHILAASSQGAGENGRPGYTAGMIPVPTSTPFVGPLLAALVPGGNGVAYIDPVGSISPVGGEALQPGEDMTGKTWYQKVLAGLGRTGLPGPNPAIKAAGYLTGLDYQPPGALSRTAGLENAAALLPESVNPRLPNTGGMLLAAGRRAISPAVGPAIGGEADPGAAVYDPVTRRYAELVLEQTGKPLADPANRAYLLAANDPDNPLLDQARRELLTSGAAKAAVSATSPVGVVARGATPAAAAAATAATPFTQAQIDAAVPALADAMTGANARYGRMTPASATYRGITPTQRQDIVLGDFDRAKRGLQQVMPKTVANQRATERLKLWDAEHLRLRKVSPAEYERQRAAFIDKLAGSPVLAP